MTFLELAKARYSVRKYLDRPVEDEKLKKVLEAGRLAPSAVNYQPLLFVVVRSPGGLERVTSTYRGEWLRTAPVVIAVCGDHASGWHRKDGKDHTDMDAAIAIDHMTLEAAELGLGTCWICNFDAAACGTALGLPQNIEVTALLPLGYPEEPGDRSRHEKRKSLDELVRWDGEEPPPHA